LYAFYSILFLTFLLYIFKFSVLRHTVSMSSEHKGGKKKRTLEGGEEEEGDEEDCGEDDDGGKLKTPAMVTRGAAKRAKTGKGEEGEEGGD
jgi:hypothetical protein